VYGLSSWTGTAIPLLLLFMAPLGSPPLMSYMAHSNHIAITSRDKSTTGSKVSVASYPVAPLIGITLRDSSDTERRNGQIRKKSIPPPFTA
jgi:hypothetical protein